MTEDARIGTPSLTGQSICSSRSTLGEGPLWDAEHGRLYWVDIKQGLLHSLDRRGSHQTHRFDSALTAIARRAGGGFIGTARRGFVLFNEALEIESDLGPVEADRPENRFNDAKVDPHGRLWAGTMDDREERPTGALYALEPDLSWSRKVDGIVITNGPAFSVAGDVLYHVDTLKRRINRYPLDASGRLGDGHEWVRFSARDGAPDGLTVDRENHLWVCHWGGWGISRIAPDGRIVGRIDIPAANVTSCTFGDEDFATLYITTATAGLTQAELNAQPLAGNVFACRPGIAGLPANQFAG